MEQAAALRSRALPRLPSPSCAVAGALPASVCLSLPGTAAEAKVGGEARARPGRRGRAAAQRMGRIIFLLYLRKGTPAPEALLPRGGRPFT